MASKKEERPTFPPPGQLIDAERRRFDFRINNETTKTINIVDIVSTEILIRYPEQFNATRCTSSMIEQNFVIHGSDAPRWKMSCYAPKKSPIEGYDEGSFRLQIREKYPKGDMFEPLCQVSFREPIDAASKLKPRVTVDNPAYPYIVRWEFKEESEMYQRVVRVEIKVSTPPATDEKKTPGQDKANSDSEPKSQSENGLAIRGRNGDPPASAEDPS